MKKIETKEQYEKALKWMVDMANHPLNPIEKDEKTRGIYNRTSLLIQDYHNEFGCSTYPVDKPEKEVTEEQDLSWLD